MWPRRTIASLLLALHLAACTSWKPTTVSPERAVQENSTIKVRLTDGSTVTIKDPWVRGDTLGGDQFNPNGQFPEMPWAVPLDSVAGIKTSDFNEWGTVGLVLGTLVVLGGIGAAIAVQNMGPVMCWGPCTN